jgi:hypothetical protein
MSRAPLSFRRPHHCGAFRPQLEVLENRLSPGSLLGVSPTHAITPGDGGDPDLAFLVGLAFSPQHSVVSSAQDRVVTTRPVVDFATRSIVFGESTVLRTDDGVSVHLTAHNLPAGAYTFWMRVDAPGFPPAAGRLAGAVVGEDGLVNFDGHVNVGQMVGNPPIPGLEGTLQDPLHATITLVVRYHGPVDPAHLYEQTHTFQPGVAVNYLISIHTPPT